MDKHLLHKRSATPNAKPLATDILHGEIAVNYADGSEALSIKNTKDEIITLPFNGGGGGVSGDYVAKSGDTMTGDLTVEGKVNIGDGNTVTGENAFVQGRATRATNLAEHANGAYNISTFISATGIEQLKDSTEATLFSVGNGVDDANRKNAFEVKWNGDVYFSGDTKFAKTITADTITANKFVGVVTGNADSADKLSTPRTITLGGDVTGSVAFDGSQDVTITTDIVGDFATNKALTDGLALKSDLTYVNTELAKKANTATTYTKDEVNASMLLKANVSDVYSKTDADAALALKYDITAADAKFATQTSLTDGLNTKVDTVTGKQLSTEDFTTAEKTKLGTLENYNDTEVKGLITAEKNRAEAAELTLTNEVATKVATVSIAEDAVNPLKYTLMVDGVSGGVINIPEDQFLESADYDAATKELVFVFKTASGETTTKIDVSDLVDTYTAGSGLTLTGKVFAIDSTVALKTDIPSITNLATKTELSNGLATKEDKGVAYSKAETDTLLDNKANVSDVYTKSATDALLIDKADKATMTTELGKKFDTTAHTAYVTTVNTALATKVDKVSGKGLSTEDFTNAEKTKLAGLSNYNDSAVTNSITAEVDRAKAAETALGTRIDGKVDTSVYTEDKKTFETKANASATYETIDNVTTKLATKQDTLTAGANVTITNNVISTKSAVESVNTKTGVVVLTATDVNAYTKTEVDTAITTAKGDIDTKLDTKVDKSVYTEDKKTFETKANASATYETKANVATIKSNLETAIGTKQATLTAGDNVTISATNEISSTSNVELVQDANDSLHYTLKVDGDNKGEINIPKDQFLKTVTYNEATKTITFTFDTEGGEVVTPIDISHLVDVYEAGNGLTLTNNSFSINTAITATKASVDLKADKTYVDTELGEKVDVTTYNTDKATFALTSTVNAELAKKFDTSAHTAYVTTVNTALDAKVDVEVGKGLSTNDYTTEEKTKLSGLTNYDDTAVKGLITTETTRATDAEIALGTRIDGTVAKTGDTMTGDLNVEANVSIGSGNTFTSGATTGKYAFAQGSGCTVSGNGSHAEGDRTNANGEGSHAEGFNTNADGGGSHAEGGDTTASGEGSHSEGYQTQAVGSSSHAEGDTTVANGTASHTEGMYAIADGNYSHAEGYQTRANNLAEHSNGVYNVSISGNSQELTALIADTQATLFSVGNGVDNQNRRNAFEVKYNGDVKVLGTINQGSDRSLKHDITSLEDGILSKVSELNPTRFVMNTDNTNKVQIGFIAQEVEEIFPEFVSSIQMSNKEVKTVNYSMMVSVLCKSIQEMKSEMDEMRKELNELKKG